MSQNPHHPKVPGTAAEIRAIYDAALARIRESNAADPAQELKRVHKDIRRRILGRRLNEGKLRRVTVSERLLQISDETLAWALSELSSSAG